MTQMLQVLQAHNGSGDRRGSTANGFIEHPLGNFKRRLRLGFLQDAPIHRPLAAIQRRHNGDLLAEPRMPAIKEFASLADMGFALMSCT